MRELLFAPSASPLRSYAARFDGTRLEPSPQNVRYEGLLFGYPPCCVESYVAHGYLPNSLPRADQSLLFHWACPDCAVTPLLVPRYRAAYRACHLARQGARTRARDGWRRRLASGGHGRALVRLAAAAALASAAGLPGRAAGDPDPHVQPLSVWEGPDADGLQDGEEACFHCDPATTDTDGDGVPDGFRVAREQWRAVQALPRAPGPTTHAVDHLLRGLVTCDVCGQTVNMGYVEIVNPPAQRRLEISCLSLHFMEHGAFTPSSGTRVNPVELDAVLRPAVVITREPGRVVLRWLGEAGRKYQIETAAEPTGSLGAPVPYLKRHRAPERRPPPSGIQWASTGGASAGELRRKRAPTCPCAEDAFALLGRLAASSDHADTISIRQGRLAVFDRHAPGR